MSWDALRWALAARAPSMPSKLLLIIMAHLDRPPAHRIFAKANTLAELAQMDRKTVLANLKRLEEAGLITRLPERALRGGAPVFVLNIDPSAITAAAGSDTQTASTSSTTPPSEVIPDFPGSDPAFPAKSTRFSHEVDPKVGHIEGIRKIEQVGIKREQRSAPKHRIPDDWQPTDSLKAWATEKRPDLDLAIVAENFRDYWISQGTARASWEASFRAWVRKERPAAGAKPRHMGFAELDYGKTGDLL